MARRRKLNVYRMAIGFHDAYVAAPSQKAAIEAWGADQDVFRRGVAERVDDPALAEAALARPGEVVKRLRGSAAEQLAALGGSEPPRTRGAANKRAAAKPRPKPSRAALERAEAAIAEARKRHAAAKSGLAERETALERERAALEDKQAKELERLQARRGKAEAAYREKLKRWPG